MKKMNCLFCKIIEGSIPSKTIYEDEKIKVFLDINPNTNGHCLMIPKKHIVTIDEIDEELTLHYLQTIKIIKKKLTEKLNIEGLTICQNNGHGQEVKHFHVHLIPRYQSDQLTISTNQNQLKDPNEILQEITD